MKDAQILPVICGELAGELDLLQFYVKEPCIRCTEGLVTLANFEKLAGKGRNRNWRRTIKCLDSQRTLYRLLELGEIVLLGDEIPVTPETSPAKEGFARIIVDRVFESPEQIEDSSPLKENAKKPVKNGSSVKKSKPTKNGVKLEQVSSEKKKKPTKNGLNHDTAISLKSEPSASNGVSESNGSSDLTAASSDSTSMLSLPAKRKRGRPKKSVQEGEEILKKPKRPSDAKLKGGVVRRYRCNNFERSLNKVSSNNKFFRGKDSSSLKCVECGAQVTDESALSLHAELFHGALPDEYTTPNITLASLQSSLEVAHPSDTNSSSTLNDHSNHLQTSSTPHQKPSSPLKKTSTSHKKSRTPLKKPTSPLKSSTSPLRKPASPPKSSCIPLRSYSSPSQSYSSPFQSYSSPLEICYLPIGPPLVPPLVPTFVSPSQMTPSLGLNDSRTDSISETASQVAGLGSTESYAEHPEGQLSNGSQYSAVLSNSRRAIQQTKNLADTLDTLSHLLSDLHQTPTPLPTHLSEMRVRSDISNDDFATFFTVFSKLQGS